MPNRPQFPLPMGRITAVQILAASCLLILNIFPAFVVLFMAGENLADYTLASDFSFIATAAFGVVVTIDGGMFLYAMGDAKRAASRFLKESNPRDLVESEMAQFDQPGKLAAKLTNEFLKAKTGIAIGFSFANLFVIGLVLADATYLNLFYSLVCFLLTILNFPTRGRVRKWIQKTLWRHREILESEIKTT